MVRCPDEFSDRLFRNSGRSEGLVPSFVLDLVVRRINMLMSTRFAKSSIRWPGEVRVLLLDAKTSGANTYSTKRGGFFVTIDEGLWFRTVAQAYVWCDGSSELGSTEVVSAAERGCPSLLYRSDAAEFAVGAYDLEALGRRLGDRGVECDPLRVQRVARAGIGFVVLHEIGHYFYQHLATIEHNIEALSPELRRGIEAQADLFALHQLPFLCMPPEVMWERVMDVEDIVCEMFRADWGGSNGVDFGCVDRRRLLEMAGGVWCVLSMLPGQDSETHPGAMSRWGAIGHQQMLGIDWGFWARAAAYVGLRNVVYFDVREHGTPRVDADVLSRIDVAVSSCLAERTKAALALRDRLARSHPELLDGVLSHAHPLEAKTRSKAHRVMSREELEERWRDLGEDGA